MINPQLRMMTVRILQLCPRFHPAKTHPKMTKKIRVRRIPPQKTKSRVMTNKRQIKVAVMSLLHTMKRKMILTWKIPQSLIKVEVAMLPLLAKLRLRSRQRRTLNREATPRVKPMSTLIKIKRMLEMFLVVIPMTVRMKTIQKEEKYL